MVIIGVDNNLLQDNLGIYHDALKRMVPGCDAWERSIVNTGYYMDLLQRLTLSPRSTLIPNKSVLGGY